MAVTGFCGHRNLHHLELRLLPSADLFAATPGALRIRISNRQRYVPLYLLQVGIGEDKVIVPTLAAGGSEVIDMALTMERRGMQPAPKIQVLSCFPVNFFVRSFDYDPARTLLVYPRPLPTPLPMNQDARGFAREEQITMPGGDGDLRSIEDYRPGDSPRAIHWKLSARHDVLKTKLLNRQAAATRVINPEQFDGPLEERLGRCAYLVNRCLQQQCAVGLVIGAKRIAPGLGRSHQVRLLKELALYE
ncbi:DUF58 domain-containing protein [Pelovirga terrestris]|uniref:DUF58 domain-containing protein n=1 Tax=Pelovirga terrestris TaxID=2771352 RepID=A0A8J6QNJ8_9BACT|nr:DUF58 domain-containing protein [Pelovirga terrestris]MBD1400927.1 DUF58 domain-containing protein [Pelovirga terrestris]